MAVLVEGISVLVSVDAIHARYNGGWERFVQLVPQQEFCCDDELARAGFMTTASALEYTDHLESFGLTFLRHGEAIDVVVCDHGTGPVTKCDWIQYARMPFENGTIGMAWKRPFPTPGSPAPFANLQLVTPPGWTFAGSLSEQY